MLETFRHSTWPARGAPLLTTLLVLAGLLGARETWGQACCAGGAALTPARLERHEWLLLGAQLQAARLIGSFDTDAEFDAPATGTSQWDFEQHWFATARLTERGQLSLLVPTVQSLREAPGVAGEAGAGLGDIEVSLRWDLTFVDEFEPAPAIALLLGVIAPTGRAAEAATHPLGSDATGTGSTQLSGAVALEEALDAWLLTLIGRVTHHFERQVSGLHTEYAPQFQLVSGASYAWNHHWTSALIASLQTRGDSTIDEQRALESSTRSFELKAAVSYSPNNDWRGHAGFSLTPPISHASKNELAKAACTLGVSYSFW